MGRRAAKGLWSPVNGTITVAEAMVRILALAVVISMAAACAGPSRPFVRLGAPTGADDGPPAARVAESVPPLRIAVASVLSPKETFRTYEDLVSYIGRRLGRATEFIQRSTYGELNALLRSSSVDIAFVCTLAYVEAAREGSAELLVTPVIDGRAEYYANVIVPMESRAASLRDLRGGVFAFTDPLSNTGWLAPAYRLWTSGETADRFFRRTIYTYSHDNSIRAVADALVDGAAVDSLVYDSTVAQRPEIARRLRVVERYGPFAAPPVIVNPALSPELKEELRALLVGLAGADEGRRILGVLGIDRFAVLDDAAYDPVRRMREALAGAGLYRP